MSDFHVEVVKIKNVRKHPNADSLSIGEAAGAPVIFQNGLYQEDDLVVYVPVDAVVPATPDWEWLGGHNRISAKRLRGVFSLGVLTKPTPDMVEGQDVADLLGITRYEPKDIPAGEADVPDPGLAPEYTDLEPLRRWVNIFKDGEEVVVTEKIHGESMRVVHDGERLHVGSRTRWKKEDPTNSFWKAAIANDLEHKLRNKPGLVFYGEEYGKNTGMKYGQSNGSVDFRAFCAMDSKSRTYLDYDTMLGHAKELGVEVVPLLYRGPWNDSVKDLAEGNTTLGTDVHVREGIVIKPVKERWHDGLGRVILKHVGQGYHLLKKK